MMDKIFNRTTLAYVFGFSMFMFLILVVGIICFPKNTQQLFDGPVFIIYMVSNGILGIYFIVGFIRMVTYNTRQAKKLIKEIRDGKFN